MLEVKDFPNIERNYFFCVCVSELGIIKGCLLNYTYIKNSMLQLQVI